MSVVAVPRARRALPALALAALLGGCGAHTLPEVTSEHERLDTAVQSMTKKQYAAASEQLKTYIEHNQGSAQVDAAYYMLGLSHMGSKEYPLAEVAFQQLLRDYPESDSAGSGSFMLAQAYWKQFRGPDFEIDFADKAIAQWRTYLATYPGHWRNEQAETMLLYARTQLAEKYMDTAALYMKLNRPGPALVYYERVDREYGDTPYAPQAWFGIARAQWAVGQLDASKALLEQLARQYAGEPIGRRAEEELHRYFGEATKKPKAPKKPTVNIPEGS